MNNSSRVVEIDGLSKRYGSNVALDNVSFVIERGEILSLLGPNGAGKSTTIEILEGYRDRSDGHVRVLGEDPARGGRAWRAKLGIVLQSSSIADEMTVHEMVSHFATFYPTPRNVDATIEAVGLGAKAKARISSLSGGQKRRVDVALGIIGRPEILFLDEPTTGFDPEARHQFWALIESLRDEGTTVLLTTHYLDEAAHLSDRAVVIAGGKIAAEGAIGTLGGAEARTPIVRWSDATGRHETRTSEPGALVASLYAEYGETDGLEIIRPSLEDIYLGIIAATEAEATGDGAGAGATSATSATGTAATVAVTRSTPAASFSTGRGQ